MKILLNIVATISFLVTVNAQVSSVWVNRYNGPVNSVDEAIVIKVDDSGFVYTGGIISTILGYPDYGVIKYNQNGDSLWVKHYTSPVNLGGNLNDLVVDKSGNVIVTGVSVGNNYSDFATVKYDAAGNELWARRYDGGDMDFAYSLAVDDLGNVLVAGSTWVINESDNYFIIKYNPDGDTLWTRTYCGITDNSDRASKIAVDKQGNVYVSGTSECYQCGWSDYVTIKHSLSGDWLWSARYNGPTNDQDYVRTIALDDFGNIYVTGESYNSSFNLDIVTIKYDTKGDSVWVKRYNGAANGDDRVNAIAVDSLGDVVITGTSFISGRGYDYLTIKYSAAGVEQWVKNYSGYSNYGDEAKSIALDNSGNVYVTGSTSSSSTNIDLATVKYDKDGNEKWVIKYNGPANAYDNANGVFVDKSGYVYVTGSSTGLGTGMDFTTIKYVQTPTIVNEPNIIPNQYSLYQNYPNPFNPSTIISYDIPENGHVKLSVYDVLGREVAILVNEYKKIGSYDVEWNASAIPSGVYMYRLQTSNFTDTKRLLFLK